LATVAYDVFVHADKDSPVTQKGRKKHLPWYKEADCAVAVF
jgi:hypothetical protein